MPHVLVCTLCTMRSSCLHCPNGDLSILILLLEMGTYSRKSRLNSTTWPNHECSNEYLPKRCSHTGNSVSSLKLELSKQIYSESLKVPNCIYIRLFCTDFWLTLLCKSLEPDHISLYYAYKEPGMLVFFKEQYMFFFRRWLLFTYFQFSPHDPVLCLHKANHLAKNQF